MKPESNHRQPEGQARPERTDQGAGQTSPFAHVELELLRTIHNLPQLREAAPDLSLPQLVLAGRSNVGKSSLINCLAGRRGLAKVSASPGKTRSINLYLAGKFGLVLADLPGYGYAKYALTERQAWGKLMEAYFASASVKAVVLLLDSRLPPQTLDLDMLGFVRKSNFRLIPVLTKTDKCPRSGLAAKCREWQDLSGGCLPVPFSSRTRQGREDLWRRMIAEAGQQPVIR